MCVVSARKAMFSSGLHRYFSLSSSPLSWVQSKYLVAYTAPSFSCWWSSKCKIAVSDHPPQPFSEKLVVALYSLSSAEAGWLWSGSWVYDTRYCWRYKVLLSRQLNSSRTTQFSSSFPGFGSEWVSPNIQSLGRVYQGTLAAPGFLHGPLGNNSFQALFGKRLYNSVQGTSKRQGWQHKCVNICVQWKGKTRITALANPPRGSGGLRVLELFWWHSICIP